MVTHNCFVRVGVGLGNEVAQLVARHRLAKAFEHLGQLVHSHVTVVIVVKLQSDA